MLDTMVEPAFACVPEHTSTAGAEAADLAVELGFRLDPEQRLALDAILAERPDGRWAAFEAALVAPRQNLKTLVLELRVIADLWLGFGSELVVWTAHEFSTAEETRRHVNELIETHSFLSRRVAKIVEQNGEEGVELVDGKRLRFKARTKSGGRGLTGDTVVLDEAFALQPSHMGALMPTMSAKSQHGNPQLLYASSAGKVESGVLRTVRDRGRAGNDPRLAYLEWCAPPKACASDRCDHRYGVSGCVLDDRAMWGRANLAMGRRISAEFIATERRSMPPEEFARERLGWWEDPEESTDGLPLDVWNECADRRSQIETVAGLGVACAHDLSWSAIAVAGWRADGLAHVEVVDYRKGVAWLAEAVAAVRGGHGMVPVALELKGPRSQVAEDLAEVDVPVTFASNDDLLAACGALYDRMMRRTLRHLAQPELDVSMKGAARRLVGDAWVWSRKASAVEISPLVATTLALWAAQGDNGAPAEADFFEI